MKKILIITCSIILDITIILFCFTASWEENPLITTATTIALLFGAYFIDKWLYNIYLITNVYQQSDDYLDEEFTHNKTYDEILEFYNEFYDQFAYREEVLREMIRNYLSRVLIDTDKEHPLECDIVIEPDETMGLSSLLMPCITEIFQHPSEGYINFRFEGSGIMDFDQMSTKDLMYILKDDNIRFKC